MAKQGLDGASVGNILATGSKANGWALCIGAGTSLPIFPSWDDLVEKLICEHTPGPPGQALAKALLEVYTPDTLIEAACDRLALDPSTFVAKLTDLLYTPLRSSIASDDWKLVANVFDAKGPGALVPDVWRSFHALRGREFSVTTASLLADQLAATFGTELAPTSILSFNAEPLLYALLNDSVANRVLSPGQTTAIKGQFVQPLDLVTRSISDRKPGRIPYVFCHGRLPVPEAQRPTPLQSTDKLVYSESQYLELSQTFFSWQSSAFMETCSSRQVLFIGVSLSDPNMRRWLSSLHKLRLQEIEEIRGVATSSTQHFWMNKRPKSSAEAEWIESTVAYLGIRLIWVDNWAQAGDTLSRLLGLA
jgi:hypothetical protein